MLTLDDVSKLRKSEKIKSILHDIEEYSVLSLSPEDIQGPVEADPEYQLIVEANNLAVEIDNDISAIHKYIRDLHAKRFSELESLVVDHLEYITTVKELGNDISRAKNTEVLKQTLTQATIMVLSVTAEQVQTANLLVCWKSNDHHCAEPIGHRRSPYRCKTHGYRWRIDSFVENTSLQRAITGQPKTGPFWIFSDVDAASHGLRISLPHRREHSTRFASKSSAPSVGKVRAGGPGWCLSRKQRR